MPTGVSQGKIRTLRLSDVLKLSLEQTKLYFVNSSILTMFFGLKICEGGGDEGGGWKSPNPPGATGLSKRNFGQGYSREKNEGHTKLGQ